MKRPGLLAPLFVATLFLTAGLRADDTKPTTPPPPGRPQMNGNRAAELLKRFDKNGDGKLDDDERADAHEAMFKEQMDRQASLGNGAAAEQFKARMLEMFDKNKDGRLDDDERAEARKYADERGLGPGGEIREDLIKRFDKNADGKLDDAERAAMGIALQARDGANGMAGLAPMRREILSRFDLDADGRIDDSEWPEVEKILRTRIGYNPQQVARYDKDNDGKLSDTEWAAAMGLIRFWLNATGDRPAQNPPGDKNK